MTTRFASAAETMGRVLGLPGYPFSTIEHPVSPDGDGRSLRGESAWNGQQNASRKRKSIQHGSCSARYIMAARVLRGERKP